MKVWTKPIDILYCYKYYLKWTETDITDGKRSPIKALLQIFHNVRKKRKKYIALYLGLYRELLETSKWKYHVTTEYNIMQWKKMTAIVNI